MGRSIGFVFAHPDDETFASGGSISKYVSRGVRCDLFCATDGDAGRSSGVPVASRTELAALRRNELISAARILGVTTLEHAGLPDGGLADVDPDLLITQIVGFLRRSRPQVVVTFGPEGGRNSHRDHRAMSRAATAAFFLAGVPTFAPDQLSESGSDARVHRAARLYYCAWLPPGAGEGPERELEIESVPATARITLGARQREDKAAAFRIHVTQRDLLPRFELAASGGAEYYALASGLAQPSEMAEDLFEGLG